MKIRKTARGFKIGEFEDMNGYRCSLQKSSLATEDCIWLGLNDPKPQIFSGDNTGWHPYELPPNVQCTTRMHLTREQVAELLPALENFVKTGDLPKASSIKRAEE